VGGGEDEDDGVGEALLGVGEAGVGDAGVGEAGVGEAGVGEPAVGEPVTPPVQAVPLRVKLVGVGLLPVHEALNPNPTLPLVAMVAL
jgi:hypothetical protein